ncbi:MAG: N-acetylmuramoyl-L-alanine amidase [Verrucomicrobiaceae bacterium]|nr:N-acetylmuramoyl-L-alanine amidase [Verrucomicrobiaceae bacterium]
MIKKATKNTSPRKTTAPLKNQAQSMTVQQARQQLNITVDLIPNTNSNRPGTPLQAKKVTIHNTDNDSAGADARAHAKYMKGTDAQQRKVSWHFTVDDGSVYQSLPVNEVGWHAATHAGNTTSLGIEICENQGINQTAANTRAALLTALMLYELHIPLAGNVVQHHDWSGKNCPHMLRATAGGWTAFLAEVKAFYDAFSADAPHSHLAALSHHAPVHALDVAPAGKRLRPRVSAAAFRFGGAAHAEGVSGVQSDILSTEFGGGSEAGMPSAYGGIVDPDEPQASLPARVPSSQRRVVVTNPANGRSVECLVNDVGPWNTHDAYWNTGSRPAAEAQHQNGDVAENGQVPSNEAGIDLTPAAMLALGVHGPVNTRKVRVDWEFV